MRSPVPQPPRCGGRRGGDYRAVRQVYRGEGWTNIVNRVDRGRRRDRGPRDHAAIVRGPSRLGVHKSVVVGDVRGRRVPGSVGDEGETERFAGSEPLRGWEGDTVGRGPATHAEPEPE